MSSTTRISNYPSVSVAALETALNYLRLAPELDETTLENLAPKVSTKLLDRVKSALNTQLPLTRLFVYQQEEGQGSKRQRTERLPHSEETLAEKRWKALLACNPHGSDADEQLKRRARVATVESLFFNNSQLIESSPYFGITASYLDIRDLCRLGATSTMFNYLTSQDSLWKPLANTLDLSELFWPEQTKRRVRENFKMVGRICRAFHFCCSTPRLRNILSEASKMEPPTETGRWEVDRRTFFKQTVKPLVSRLSDEGLAYPIDFKLTTFTEPGPSGGHSYQLYKPTIDYALSIVDMLAASGCSKKELFKGLLYSYSQDQSVQPEPLENALADSMDRLLGPDSSLETDDGVLWDLLKTFGWISPSRFVPIALRMFQNQGVRAESPELVGFAREGILELFEPLVTKHRDRVFLGMRDAPNENDFAAIITALAYSHRPLTVEQILRTIDLLQTHLRPALPLDWDITSWTECYGIKGLQRLDPFLGIARYRNDALMQRVIALGLKPINSPRACKDPWTKKEYSFDPSLTTALTNFSALSRNPALDPGYQTIALLVKYGAKPPEKVLEMIEENAQISFEVKMALERLFAPNPLEESEL